MLYKFSASNTDIDRLEPIAFKDFAGLGKLEKDLEQLIANSILEVLFEDGISEKAGDPRQSFEVLSC